MKMYKQNFRDDNLATKYQTPGQLTTVMIRNIPSEYTQDDLIDEVSESLGWRDLFDFFYLPWDMVNNANIGYAFVNLKDTATAQRAVHVFSNYRFKRCESRKVAKVLPAHIQGLENNLRHLQDRAVCHGNHPYTPVVMWNGAKIELSKVFHEFRAQAAAQEQLDGNMAPPGLRKSAQSHRPPSPLWDKSSSFDASSGSGEPGHGFANMMRSGHKEARTDEFTDFCDMMDRAAGIQRTMDPRRAADGDADPFEDSIPQPSFGLLSGSAGSGISEGRMGGRASSNGSSSGSNRGNPSGSNRGNPPRTVDSQAQAFLAQSGLELFGHTPASPSAPGRSSHHSSAARSAPSMPFADGPSLQQGAGAWPSESPPPALFAPTTLQTGNEGEFNDGSFFEEHITFAQISDEAAIEIILGSTHNDVLRRFLSTFQE